MLYEISYDGGHWNVFAANDNEAMAAFRWSFEEFGDVAPACWITARWHA